MLAADSLIAAFCLSFWRPGLTGQLVLLFGLCDAAGTGFGVVALVPLYGLGLLCLLRDWRLAVPFILATDNAFDAASPGDALSDGLNSAAMAAVGFMLLPVIGWLRSSVRSRRATLTTGS